MFHIDTEAENNCISHQKQEEDPEEATVVMERGMAPKKRIYGPGGIWGGMKDFKKNMTFEDLIIKSY